MIFTTQRLVCERGTARKTKQFRNHIMAHVHIFSNSSNWFYFHPSKEWNCYACSSDIIFITLYHVRRISSFFTFLVSLFVHLFNTCVLTMWISDIVNFTLSHNIAINIIEHCTRGTLVIWKRCDPLGSCF